MVLTLLTATAFAKRPDYMLPAGLIHIFAWIAQFIGHGVAEKRSPALLDNIIGGKHVSLVYFVSYNFQAAVLAPFFVHLELLFKLGYRPEMHKRLMNDIGKEVTRIRRLEGDKRRATEVKKEL